MSEYQDETPREVIPAGWKPTAAEPIPPVQCTVTAKSTGKRCKRWSLRGATVCVKHGGRLPNVAAHAEAAVESARMRLIGLADTMVDVLEDLALNSTADQVRLGAARDVLDRANVKGDTKIDVKVEHSLETAAERTRRHLEETAKRLEAARQAREAEIDQIAEDAGEAAVRFARGLAALSGQEETDDEDIEDAEVIDD